jgi:competence protein ComEC
MGLRLALVLFAITGLVWLLLGRYEKSSLAAFYAFTASAALAYTLTLGRTIPVDDLRLLPDEKTLATTQWRGVIMEEPATQLSSFATRRSSDRTTFALRIEAWRSTGGRLFGADIDTPWQSAQGDIRCTLTGGGHDLRLGDRLDFAAALEPMAAPLSPGGLDYREWSARQGIYYETFIPTLNWERIDTGGGDWLRELSFRARDWAYSRLQIGLEDDPRMADFLAGMLIGYRQEIPADIEQDFRRTGTLHVFAVSGQNIAEMLVVILVLLQLCGLVRWRWAWLIAPLVLLYCLLTGSPASAIRATVMALAILLAWRLGRPLNALGCWSIAFLALLIWDPTVLFDPGAQLSFAVVLGLILLAPPITRWLVRPFLPDPFLPPKLLTLWQSRENLFWWWACALLGTGIAATLMSEPITSIAFHQITPISILANLVVVPVAGLITMIGTLSVSISLISTQLAAWLNNTNWLLARGLIAFVGFLAHEPGSSINVPDLRSLSLPPPSFIVAPLQDSACLLVRTGDRDWLFNSGEETQARSATSHLLQFYGINRLEGLALTQMSVPDNGGAKIIARDFHPRHLVVPVLNTHSQMEKAVPDVAALASDALDSWQRGDRRELAPGVDVEVLHPAPDSPETHAEDRALVLLFHARGQTLLWAGKIGPQTQEEILAAYPGLHADVLIMGAESPPSPEWLRALQVRHWLQIPARDRLNSALSGDISGLCKVWPLDQTGAVEVHFQAGARNEPPRIVLRPWVALPKEP